MPSRPTYEELKRMIQVFFQAFEHTGDAGFVYQLEEDGSPGRFIEANHTACKKLGYTKDELLQRTPLEIGLISPELKYDASANELIEKGDVRYEGVMVSSKGQKFPVENHIRLFEQNGRRFVLSVSRDIGEETPYEYLPGDREEKYRHLVENSKDIFFILDTRGYFTYVSPSVGRLMGYMPREIVGRPFTEFVHPDHHPFLVKRFKKLFKGNELASDYRIVDKRGAIRWVYSSTAPTIENGKVVRLQGILHDITDRKNTEEALRFNQKLLRDVMDIAPAFICAKDLQGRFLLANKKLADFYGTTVDEMTGQFHADICENKEELQSMLAADREVIRNGHPKHIPEETMENPDGSVSVLETYKIPFTASDDPAVLIVSSDITERKRAADERKNLEAQFRQAQKLESVGRLAGGVAHDLNNLLSPILGYGDILLMDFDDNDTRKSYVEQIIQAGVRARDIVHQLLAFSRKQALEFKPVELNKVLNRFEQLLRRTIREDIAIRCMPGRQIPFIRGDIGQLEQVIMNLAVNAQDAMPKGGTLTFETFRTELDASYAAVHKGVTPGNYVMLAVSDTGSGMDNETCDHIFEPFFSTKGEQGSGLGLATVYGIVKQHGGNIWVYSEVDKGTTFKIYLPVSEEGGVSTGNDVVRPSDLHGTETILIVEDNEQVRELSHAILERQDYKVLIAGNGQEALAIIERYKGTVNLLLTDVVMPKMDGKSLFDRVSDYHPEVKVLYMSGYTDDVIAHRGVLDKGVNFIQKPFSVQALAAKVRGVLDG